MKLLKRYYLFYQASFSVSTLGRYFLNKKKNYVHSHRLLIFSDLFVKHTGDGFALVPRHYNNNRDFLPTLETSFLTTSTDGGIIALFRTSCVRISKLIKTNITTHRIS